MLANKIDELDFAFENSLVKIVANRNCQKIALAGLEVGPFEEGNEYRVRYWIARELVNSGIARFREDRLELARLAKTQWKERVQSSRRMSKLPENFYPKLRRYFQKLELEITKKPDKTLEREKANQLAQDIINSRVKKIVSLASAPTQTQQTLNDLTREERLLYNEIHNLVDEWRIQAIKNAGGDE